MAITNGTAGVSINRVMSGNKADVFTIAIDDDLAGVRVCTITLTGEQFAGLVTGMHQSKVPIEYFGVDLIGKQSEHRAVNIYTYANQRTNPKWREEVDFDFCTQHPTLYAEGWRIAYYGWVNNPHSSIGVRDGVPGYSASLVRYVEVDS